MENSEQRFLASIDQERAKFAYDLMREVKDQPWDGDYKSYVRRAPAMILTNGLIQTLAFYNSKKAQKPAYGVLFEQIDTWLRKKGYFKKPCNGGGESSRNSLEWLINCADGMELYMATEEVLALLNWLRRFADAMIEREGEEE